MLEPPVGDGVARRRIDRGDALACPLDPPRGPVHTRGRLAERQAAPFEGRDRPHRVAGCAVESKQGSRKRILVAPAVAGTAAAGDDDRPEQTDEKNPPSSPGLNVGRGKLRLKLERRPPKAEL